MLADSWEIFKICFAVPNLEVAMAEYERALGIVWGPIRIPHGVAPSDVFEGGISHEGSVAVLSTNTPESAFPGLPAAALELAYAEAGSPAFALWGCPDGKTYLHHIAYWVDDIAAESRHLLECGWRRELYLPAEGEPRVIYHQSRLGLRVSLLSSSVKAATATRIAAGGERPFEWPADAPRQ